MLPIAPKPPDATFPPIRRVIKLGGAAVTHKAQLETLQHDVLHRVCQSLATSGDDGCAGTVLVHGAGSFGHHPASEYGLARGPLDSSRMRQGFSLTRSSVTKLNGHVVFGMVEAGLHAVGISPLGHYTTCNGEITRSGARAVAECVQSGLLPVLHGDAVLDEQLGCTILSGDTLVRDLAEHLRPQYVVFLTNVAGVYDRPPEEEGALLLRRIVVRQDGSWRVADADDRAPTRIRMTADAHDVTGGIALKVEEAARVARLGVPVIIAQAGTEDGAAACQLGPGALAAALAVAGSGEPGCRTDAEGAEASSRGGDGWAAGESRGGAPVSTRSWRGTLVVLEEGEAPAA